MKYVYTAILSPSSHGFSCRVPDLPGCITTGKDLDDAIDMITDAASVWLCSAEDHEDPIINPTPQGDIPHKSTDILSLIKIDTFLYRAETDNHAVRKSVSLPAWMAKLADKRGINCSQVLQEGLANQLRA
ncbi:MAG: type II toxin-antitoxin system HicB family antitoxin [Lachnospiraceae bacterium]|nr:type II toxin-antitoxin system HicB family antitoxin [Lachnospiraceae bacterium]